MDYHCDFAHAEKGSLASSKKTDWLFFLDLKSAYSKISRKRLFEVFSEIFKGDQKKLRMCKQLYKNLALQIGDTEPIYTERGTHMGLGLSCPGFILVLDKMIAWLISKGWTYRSKRLHLKARKNGRQEFLPKEFTVD